MPVKKIISPDTFLKMVESDIDYNDSYAPIWAMPCFMMRNPEAYKKDKDFYYCHHPIIFTKELFERAEQLASDMKNYYIVKYGTTNITPSVNNRIKHLI